MSTTSASSAAPSAPNGALAPGMGAKALLAKKMSKNVNPSFVSPTDNLMTPCSQKINAAKKKHFTKGAAKPMPKLFAQAESSSSDSEPVVDSKTQDDEENPF